MSDASALIPPSICDSEQETDSKEDDRYQPLVTPHCRKRCLGIFVTPH
jgi:hypothetical protein